MDQTNVGTMPARAADAGRTRAGTPRLAKSQFLCLVESNAAVDAFPAQQVADWTWLTTSPAVYEKLLAEGTRARVVSMPSWDIFERQPRDYQNSVLPPSVKARVAVQQASTFGWERYVGQEGRVIGMHTFGASAPLKELQKKFGFEPDQVVQVAKELLEKVSDH